jgi:serralysin
LLGVSTDLAGLLANGSIVGIDNLVPTPVVGTTGADTLAAAATSTLVQGLGGNDSLTGGAGFDTLDGGTGTDTMSGGTGSDTYIVDSAKDVISETGVDLDDRIQASITIDLNAAVYAGIEHVTLTGTGALHATGNGGDNLLIGNAGANILDGQVGADTLAGGAGNDTYTVDSLGDVVNENAGEGTDQVNSSASFVLGADVENLTLTGTSGISGNGNDLGNKIIGNAGDNFLSGNNGNDTLTGNEGNDQFFGGGGADSMNGGTGNDIYEVDESGDKVSETSASGGTDRVDSSITYTLGSNLENLTLANGRTIDGTGNSLNNSITGGDGDNVLSGLVGNDTLAGADGDDQLLGGDGADLLQAAAGADTLAGGAGSDRFAFDADGLDGRDLITDFTSAPGGDILDVSDLLVGFDPSTSNINKFLQTTVADGATFVQVDANGGGNSFVDMAVLVGVTTDVMGLLNNGSLVLAD